MAFRVKTLLPYQELLLDVEEHRKKSYEQGYDLLVMRGRNGSITVVTPEGAGQVIKLVDEGELEAFIAKRAAAWAMPVLAEPHRPPVAPDHSCHRLARRLLNLSRDANVFSGTSGNLSVRVSGTGFCLVSPTGVAKEHLRPEDLVFAREIPGTPSVGYLGERKPSVDLPLQLAVYRRFPNVVAMLHAHADRCFVEEPLVTSFPYPCGTLEESQEVLRTLTRDARSEDGFCLELVHHGYLIGFTAAGLRCAAKKMGGYVGDVAPWHGGDTSHVRGVFRRGRLVSWAPANEPS